MSALKCQACKLYFIDHTLCIYSRSTECGYWKYIIKAFPAFLSDSACECSASICISQIARYHSFQSKSEIKKMI